MKMKKLIIIGVTACLLLSSLTSCISKRPHWERKTVIPGERYQVKSDGEPVFTVTGPAQGHYSFHGRSVEIDASIDLSGMSDYQKGVVGSGSILLGTACAQPLEHYLDDDLRLEGCRRDLYQITTGDMQGAIDIEMARFYTPQLKGELRLDKVTAKPVRRMGLDCTDIAERQSFGRGRGRVLAFTTCAVAVRGELWVFDIGHDIYVDKAEFEAHYGRPLPSMEELRAMVDRHLQPFLDSIEFHVEFTQDPTKLDKEKYAPFFSVLKLQPPQW